MILHYTLLNMPLYAGVSMSKVLISEMEMLSQMAYSSSDLLNTHCQIAFYSGFTNLNSHQQNVKFPAI